MTLLALIGALYTLYTLSVSYFCSVKSFKYFSWPASSEPGMKLYLFIDDFSLTFLLKIPCCPARGSFVF